MPASSQKTINLMAVALSLNTQEFYYIALFVHVVEQHRVFLLIAVIWCLSLLIDTVVPCHQQPRVLWLYWSHLLSSCCAQALWDETDMRHSHRHQDLFSAPLRPQLVHLHSDEAPEDLYYWNITPLGDDVLSATYKNSTIMSECSS